ncbi:MAG: hypothetical protein DLD55_00035 [candidate division SR1 bacterium]|nr:MAG: hypothetical protein DLD55_00035 [candidate division SR1 bacterium]
MNDKYIAPKLDSRAFNCPHCGILTQQEWKDLYYFNYDAKNLSLWKVCFCGHCSLYSIWYDKKMIFPSTSNIPIPHTDMPESVKELYNEAREIAGKSPRAAAALLRVALEKLTEELGETEGKLNTRIGNLKKKGLPERAIQALDIVRITANEGGSHLGQIDLTGRDNTELVNQLFFLLNFIVEHVISVNNQLDAMYAALPEDKKKGIENRDNQP